MKNYTLPFTIICLGLILFWALRPIDITTKVSGQIFHQEKGLSNVEVTVLNKNYESIGYYEPSKESGVYILRFPAMEGSHMNLKFKKSNYSTLITEYIPSGDSLKFDFNDVHLIKLTNNNRFAQKINNNFFEVYNSMDRKKAISFPTSNIDYFTFIEKASNLTSITDGQDNTKQGYWYEVTFYLKDNSEQPQSGYFFEESL